MRNFAEGSIPIVSYDEGAADQSKGIWEEARNQVRKVAAVSATELSAQLASFTTELSTVFNNICSKVGEYQLEAVEIMVEITAKGEVRLIGSASSGLKGGLKLVFKHGK